MPNRRSCSELAAEMRYWSNIFSDNLDRLCGDPPNETIIASAKEIQRAHDALGRLMPELTINQWEASKLIPDE